MNLNRIMMAGNLTKDPELRKTPTGKVVTKISIAANARYGTGEDRKTDTTYIEVDVWGVPGENLSKLARKGQEILVEGSLKQDTWEDKQTGESRSKYFIRADSWQFTQKKVQEPQSIEA